MEPTYASPAPTPSVYGANPKATFCPTPQRRSGSAPTLSTRGSNSKRVGTKSKPLRNKIKVRRNKIQIRRNKIQIRNPSLSILEFSHFNDLRRSRGRRALRVHRRVVGRSSLGCFGVLRSHGASGGLAPFVIADDRAPFPSDLSAAEPHREERDPGVPEHKHRGPGQRQVDRSDVQHRFRPQRSPNRFRAQDKRTGASPSCQ